MVVFPRLCRLSSLRHRLYNDLTRYLNPRVPTRHGSETSRDFCLGRSARVFEIEPARSGRAVDLVEAEIARVEGLDIYFRIILHIEPVLVRSSCSVGRTKSQSWKGLAEELLFKWRPWFLDISSLLCSSRDLCHSAQLVLQPLRSVVIGPLDTTIVGLLGIAGESDENEGGKSESNADP